MVTKISPIPKSSVFQQILSGPSQVSDDTCSRPLKQVWKVHLGLLSAINVLLIFMCFIFPLEKKRVIKIMSLVLSLWQLICFWVFVRVNFQKQQEVRLYIKCSVNFMQFFMLDICFLLLFTNITKEFLSKFIFKGQV